jgi:hypothetical protein
VLRRRSPGRYVSADELAELMLDTPRGVRPLIANAVHLRVRMAGNRACREQWLAGCIDDRDLNVAMWQLTQTGLAAADMMNAVCTAAAHPKLREQAVVGEYDIGAAVRALRCDLARMTSLADATAIDAALAVVDDQKRRRHTRDHAAEHLVGRRAALAAARAAHGLSAGAGEVATAIGRPCQARGGVPAPAVAPRVPLLAGTGNPPGRGTDGADGEEHQRGVGPSGRRAGQAVR